MGSPALRTILQTPEHGYRAHPTSKQPLVPMAMCSAVSVRLARRVQPATLETGLQARWVAARCSGWPTSAAARRRLRRRLTLHSCVCVVAVLDVVGPYFAAQHFQHI